MASKIQTITIDNFGGALTSESIGTLNSGLQPLALSPWGRLPFNNPYRKKGLQFIEGSYALGGNTLHDLPLHTIKSFTTNPIIAGVGMSGSFFTVGVSNVSTPTPDLDTLTNFTNSVGDTLNYGGGLYYDGNTQVLVIGTDSGVYYSSANPLANPTTATFSAVTGGSFTGSRPRPIIQFLGTLYVGDGNKLVSLSSNYQTVANTSVLSPTLPSGWTIRNLAVSTDGRYMVITASQQVQTNDFKISSGQQPQYVPIDTVVVYWNGSDTTYSSFQYFKGLNIVSIASSATDMIMLAKDNQGTGIFDLSGNRLASIDDVTESGGTDFTNYPPSVFSVDAIGKNFYFGMQIGTYLYLMMFDSGTGELFSLYQDSALNNLGMMGGVCVASVHANAIISSAWKEATRSKLYYFYKDFSTGNFYGRALHLQNYGGNVAGAYNTQYQEFGRMIRPVTVRVYSTPTASGQGWYTRLYDLNLNQLLSGLYQYAAGTDNTKAQGSMTMVEFAVSSKPVSSLMLQIVPANSTSLNIEKVEIDYIEVMNPQG